MTAFRPLVDNPDLDVHPDPHDQWERVAVACGWKDAGTRRKKWPHAAVVGPLRTVCGIDYMVRSLLANPQIRVVVWDGPDLTPNESTKAALLDFFCEGKRPPSLGEDLSDEMCDQIRRGVILLSVGELVPVDDTLAWVEDVDRPDERIELPPPMADLGEGLPIGDPGQRVAGETLSEVWPLALQQALAFGRQIPSQHGDAREVLHLVSVIRDPCEAVREVDLRRAPWMGFGPEEMDAYARRVTRAWKPADADYSYGTRIGQAQFDLVSQLLQDEPGSRAIGVTPWQPATDLAGLVKGRPCIVWVQFRTVGDELHLIVVFRSHDLYAAYPQNLAAMAVWLCREADQAGLAVGAVTCVSVSAHLYSRDWVDAQKVVAEHLPKGPQWDQRSSWHVERVDGKVRATALTPDGSEALTTFEARTPEGLQAKIERSGLVTSIGGALWLGQQIQKVWQSGGTS